MKIRGLRGERPPNDNGGGGVDQFTYARSRSKKPPSELPIQIAALIRPEDHAALLRFFGDDGVSRELKYEVFVALDDRAWSLCPPKGTAAAHQVLDNIFAHMTIDEIDLFGLLVSHPHVPRVERLRFIMKLAREFDVKAPPDYKDPPNIPIPVQKRIATCVIAFVAVTFLVIVVIGALK